ncbi:WD40-repeat-containing domain protein [Zychaea mexicana]|uniref:WD40-repeat-containing domain protein n=1 Tax=Zychaea mexicana TaxID=64656 RepID=UPI0022FF1CB6|nr:WD40-repeat-containing domain protein [Zychaea mexicana]KAI9496120.1 WD40-repeat-containing domain protein [Zychaea mexicana]
MTVAFKLESTLHAHEQDVRAVGALSNDVIVSAARDKTVRTWQRVSPNQFEPAQAYRGHDHFVNSLAIIPPSEHHPNGMFASGGSDKLINVYDPSVPNAALYTLIGHSENVSALATTPGGNIVSGSWDTTVIVWKNFQQAYTLKGHTAAVWAVLALEEDLILTAAADKTIRLWKDGKHIRTYHGHTDAVRGLAKVPGVGFLSCANDSTLRVWTLDGDCVQELNGHTSFVYSVSVLSTGEYVSSGEDRTVRIWKDGECIQTIQQPCISVWAVGALPNDDIIVGGSDGVVRVFSRAPERMADAETQKQLEDLIAAQAIPSNQVGDINKDKLEGPEALNKPGKKEGQVIMVNTGGSVEAHQWSSQTQSWQKIGEVVGGVGSGNKQLYEGKEYDYVFDIDIGAGPQAMLKLPYNVTENPYQAAQNFIWRHELSQGFLDQIADFITKNAQGVELGQGNEGYQDPYTGGSRYTPGSGASTFGNPPPNQFMDPFTGSSSYRGQSTQMITETKSPVPKQKILPLTTYLSLKQANLDAVMSKLQSNDSEMGSLKLSGDDMNTLSMSLAYLSNPSSGNVNVNGIEILVKLCYTWPPEKRFPALDLLRLFVLYTPESISAVVPDNDVIGFLRQVGGLDKPSSEKVAVTNAMLAYRGLSNLFIKPAGRELVWAKHNTVAEVLQPDVFGAYNAKTARLAISTLAVNFAVFLTMHSESDEDCQVGLAGSLVELLKVEQDEENLYRVLVALGTLMVHSEPCREVASIMGAKVELLRIKTQAAGKQRIESVTDEMVPLVKLE